MPSPERPVETSAAAAETPAKGRTTAEDRDTGVAGWHQARNLSPLPRWKPQETAEKKKLKTRESFNRNPYAFTKKLFTTAKSDIPQEELEDHLKKTYSDPLKEVPPPPMDGIPPLKEPETPFRAGGCRLYEAREFIRKSSACSSPGLNQLFHNPGAQLHSVTSVFQKEWRFDPIISLASERVHQTK